MLKGLLAGSSTKSPEHWETVVADLEARMAALRQRIDASATERVELAKAAAGGDTAARSRLDRADNTDRVLWAEFDRLQPALAKARAELNTLQSRQRTAHRRSDMAALRKALMERLKVAAEVENMLRALAQDIAKMAQLAHEARQHCAALNGGQEPQPDGGTLSDAAAANRLLGFALRLGAEDLLRAMQPGEAQPIDTLLGKENEAQKAILASLDQPAKPGGAG
jgi:DNA repair ATPase RecN